MKTLRTVTNLKDAEEAIRQRRAFSLRNLMTTFDQDGTYIVYSYSQAIARVPIEGEPQLDETFYSSTTSRHQRICRRALTELTY